MVGGFIRPVAQFVAGFIPAAKALKAAGMTSSLARGFVGGAIADATVFDPHEARLSTLLNEIPALEKIVPELRVLYISGYPGNVLENHGILGKEENFLPKPFSVRVFAQKVRTLLDT